MTAKTVASHVGPTIEIKKDGISRKIVWGKLAGTYVPGDVVYESSAGVWTQVTTSAGNLNRVGVVGFNPRSPSGVRKDIDDAYTTSEDVPIHLKGIVTARIVDQNAARARGIRLTYSTTAGALTAWAATEVCLAIVEEAYADDDTYVRVELVGA
jgi:hypothetical protein